ncbi:ATP-binding cassette domain-containing protein [Jiangella endophytica]|uniref:ATP-binding cassette domain-containing protein n=1 Tax=Jiangella endophytica TaxID=1623398 RepID=UPI000E34E279|nr:ATP-binding cassette domain-containing protein [Jiangella endophytica]
MTASGLLEIQDLRVEFAGRRRHDAGVLAADGVSLRIDDAETLGLVGESGSGKSTIGNAVLGLVKPAAGRILFRGQDVTHATTRERRRLGQHIQVVFQDPYSSLNPSRTIGQTLGEQLRLVRGLDRRTTRIHVENVLRQVGMPADTMSRYPAEFSGGQRQRIAIARALVMEPDLVICDEPTSALDLSVQAQILNLLLDLQARLGLGYLFISHDIDVVRHMSHRVAVLLHGRVVEQGPAEGVTRHPDHEYTRTLVAAVPSVDVAAEAPPNGRAPHRNEQGEA